jgi:Rod binding domain-containing protein
MLINSAISAGLLGAKGMDPQKAEAAAHDFESLFISQMVEQMLGESIGSDAFGSEDSDEVYKGLMVQEYGKMITQSGGIGIADYVKRELLKQQEM